MGSDTKQNTLKDKNYAEYMHDIEKSVTREVSKLLPGREKLFKKVVTQSDIKHYRLAIPKHQVKRHFLQHLSISSKGASLCMEDNEGKQWKFRLSFWKSCQGYMITREWNRFVQRKNLKAGDTVSFLCSTGPEKRLYIESEPSNGLGKAKKPDPLEPIPRTAVKLFGVIISTTFK